MASPVRSRRHRSMAAAMSRTRRRGSRPGSSVTLILTNDNCAQPRCSVVLWASPYSMETADPIHGSPALQSCGEDRHHALLLRGRDLREERQGQYFARSPFGDRERTLRVSQAGERGAEVNRHGIMNPSADTCRMQFLDHPVPVRHAYHVQMPYMVVAVQNAWPDDLLNAGHQRAV